MRFSVLWLTALSAAAPLTTPHEKRSTGGVHIKRSLSLQDSTIVPVRIGLVQRNLDRGYDHVMDVSSPLSPNYGRHWTVDQVNAEFAPSEASINVVRDWLTQSGIRNFRQSASTGWFAFDAPASQVAELLQTTIFEYHDTQGHVRLGCDEYFLPPHVADVVDYITPGVKLSPPVSVVRTKRRDASKRPSSTANRLTARTSDLSADLRNCSNAVTPPCLRALYNLPFPTSKIEKGDMGVFEEGSVDEQGDLDSFFTRYAPYVPNGTHPELVSINGATAPDPNAGDPSEADVDLELAYAILGDSDITLFQTTSPGTQPIYPVNGTFYESFLDAIDGSYCTAQDKSEGYDCGTASLTKVISISYSVPELFWQSAKSQERVCSEFMKLALRGHTVVIASGDYGIATNPGFGFSFCGSNGCYPADLQNNANPYNGTVFNVQFPSNCPYVLSVGATQMSSNETVNDPESAMDNNQGWAACNPSVRFASSGGFSNYFDRPSYQDQAVSQYLEHYVPKYPYYISNRLDVSNNKTSIASNGGLYSRQGRGFPDVSCNGVNFTYFSGGAEGSSSGTSLSTPIWASIIALINSDRQAAGKSAVGFVNPVLYQNPGAFNDITRGMNPGCGTDGFPAVSGWDPVTGLGTPNFPKLQAVFASLP